MRGSLQTTRFTAVMGSARSKPTRVFFWCAGKTCIARCCERLMSVYVTLTTVVAAVGSSQFPVTCEEVGALRITTIVARQIWQSSAQSVSSNRLPCSLCAGKHLPASRQTAIRTHTTDATFTPRASHTYIKLSPQLHGTVRFCVLVGPASASWHQTPSTVSLPLEPSSSDLHSTPAQAQGIHAC